ncbi:MAG: PQQ-binding-like beta-propeller repeat protein [Candidatus Helarchaeota archaeon]|nr:PQQ-binding-like beta-propeller repeat protein [Candidatus Helarchaeota archaeon]
MRKFRALVFIGIIVTLIFQIPQQVSATETWLNPNLPDLPTLFVLYRPLSSTDSHFPNGTSFHNPGPIYASTIQGVYLMDFEHSGIIDDLVIDQAGGYTVLINGTDILCTNPDPFGFPIVIGDFDRDGFIDDITGKSTSGFYNESGFLCDWTIMINQTPNENYSKVYRSFYSSYYYCTPMGVGDLNGDGYSDDILMYAGQPFDRNWSLFAFQRGASATPHWQFWFPFNRSEEPPYSYSFSMSDLEIGDFDADGIEDDVVATFDFNRTYVINGEGALLWNFTTTAMVQSIRLADLDDDGVKDEIVLVGNDTYLWAFNRTGGLLWNWSGIGPLSAVGICELNGMSGDDIVVGGFNGGVVAFNSSGKVLWMKNFTHPISSIEAGKMYPPYLVDDLLIAEVPRLNSVSDSLLHCLNASGQDFWGELPEVFSIKISDLDGNGYTDDFIAFTSRHLKSYIMKPLNITGFVPEDPLRIDWFLGGTKHFTLTISTPERIALEWFWRGHTYCLTNRPYDELYRYDYDQEKSVWKAEVRLLVEWELGSAQRSINLYYLGINVANIVFTVHSTIFLLLGILAVCIIVVILVIRRLRRKY